MVHAENITRYEKIIQIANTIVEELRLEHHFKTPVMRSVVPIPGYEVVKIEQGFDNSILYDTQKIPVTEDYTTVYTLKKSPKSRTDLDIRLENGKLLAGGVQIEFVIREDKGDTYNFGAVEGDYGKTAEIFEISGNTIKTSFFDVKFERGESLLHFAINWENTLKDKLWQVRFLMPEPVRETYSEDMNTIIRREFDPDYDMLQHLPKKRGIEVKTNFAPMQRMVWAQGLGIITKGLTEYEVFKNGLSVTILRSTGVISNPHNPSRSTPAGPPVEVPQAQQSGPNSAEFAIGFFNVEDYQKHIDEVFPHY